mgnify:CR=1 FL=1
MYGTIRGIARHGDKCSLTIEVPGGNRKTYILPASEYNVASANMNRATVILPAGRIKVIR